jgi:hypothetical protein
LHTTQRKTRFSPLVGPPCFSAIQGVFDLLAFWRSLSTIINYLNAGGGICAMPESGPPDGLASTGLFGYLPFVVSTKTKNQTEVGNTVTAFGQSLGLSNSDINGNASHNIFLATSGLDVVDFDSNGEILSLAGRGFVTPVGIVPEPTTLTLAGIGVAFLAAYGLRQWKRQAA